MRCPRWFQPVSMHAEMHAIFSLTGMSPSFKTQVQGMERRVTGGTPPQLHTTKGSKGCAGSEGHLSEPIDTATDRQLQHEHKSQSDAFFQQL